MSLKIARKNVVNIVGEGKVFAAIYQGSLLIWEAVRSCFGSGMWISKKPWLYKEGWRNTKKY